MGKVHLQVEGMTCASCAANITNLLKRRGITNASVDFTTGEVVFEAELDAEALEEIKQGIRKLGYQLPEDRKGQSFWTLERKLIVSAIFTLPLLAGHFLMMAGNHLLSDPWLQLGLCLPVYLIGFFHFGKSSWAALRQGNTHMDVLIFIGSTAAFVYSLIGTFTHQHQYIFYETSATIITLVLLGNYLEKRAVKQTTTAIEELSKLQVEHARKIMPSGAVVTVEVESIMPGDQLLVNEGDQVPVDGEILKGSADVDESMLTGESLPVGKSVGDRVMAGSVVVNGHLTIAATSSSRDTILARMIELVRSAQHDKPAIQRLADRISSVFVPVVLVIAALTFLLSTFVFGISPQQAMMNSIAVLVISCPCAMGLATPTAVMVGVGRLARQGILIKGGATVEVFSKVQNIVFDKTGTLTSGDFKIQKIDYYNEDPEFVNSLIYRMERHSSHPIARSLIATIENDPQYRANGAELRFKTIKEEKGKGVLAVTDGGVTYRLGTRRFALHAGDAPSDASIYLSKEGDLIAAIFIEDEIRKEAAEVVQWLERHGRQVILLSGDSEAKTASVARRLGIKNWYAEKLPDEKLAIIESLSAQEPTAMVGDGINDAPALARATVGVSLGEASPIAIQSAQVILLKSSLRKLIDALTITEATVQTIRQNLFWAFAYNIVAIPVAALGFLNPMWGALFMAFSDVVVIGNSIRLKTRRLKQE
ncbi:MAG: copper-translocating P-type ATPase [Saprospiraceae bacterium]|nr:MAG: copper-translocating P-type ATPase [Saprospiraceae bacterium]